MNTLGFMLNEIKHTIPSHILNLAFENKTFRVVTSIDDRIMNNVIRARLMPHLNVASQESLLVYRGDCQVVTNNEYETVYRVPKRVTGGRAIVNVTILADGSGLYSASNGVYAGTSDIQAFGQKMMNNIGTLNLVQTAKIDLIAENTILVYDSSVEAGDFYFNVILENDANLTNINPRAYIELSKLAVLITKAYIYNKVVVELEKNQLYQGHELGIVREIINEYNTAEDDYLEYYDTVWRKVAFMQNSQNMDKYIRLMTGNHI